VVLVVKLRWARPGDERAVATVHVRSWQIAYRKLLPREYLDSLQPQERAARYRFAERLPGGAETRVAVDQDDRILGFATIGASRDADRQTSGEVYALYVDPDIWERHVGRALMLDVHRRLADRGYATANLWVLAGNDRAERFYRSHGWRPDGARRREELHGITVEDVRYGRSLA
jgi:GNAT superfamily N-acetyltransferase